MTMTDDRVMMMTDEGLMGRRVDGRVGGRVMGEWWVMGGRVTGEMSGDDDDDDRRARTGDDGDDGRWAGWCDVRWVGTMGATMRWAGDAGRGGLANGRMGNDEPGCRRAAAGDGWVMMGDGRVSGDERRMMGDGRAGDGQMSMTMVGDEGG